MTIKRYDLTLSARGAWVMYDDVVALEAENVKLREALQTIAGFAPGNGDVCEIIARRCRAALYPPDSPL